MPTTRMIRVSHSARLNIIYVEINKCYICASRRARLNSLESINFHPRCAGIYVIYYKIHEKEACNANSAEDVKAFFFPPAFAGESYRGRRVTRGERATAGAPAASREKRACTFKARLALFFPFAKRSDSVEEIKRGALPIRDLSLNPAVVSRVH